MNVYSVSERLKVFILLFSLLQIAVFGGFLLIPFMTLPTKSIAVKIYQSCCSSICLYYFMPLVFLGAIIIFTVLIISTFRKKVVITNNAIISKNFFETRKLNFNEVKGYSVNRFAVDIVPNSKSKKQISINLFSLNRTDNLIQNLEIRFTNLDYNAS
ncbi:MAG: hypothetical protein EOO44_06890 [Flavobacterium sp.]|nr:MAG: hypothetical protein EOO44_06890 [Flavobacterium sp.]